MITSLSDWHDRRHLRDRAALTRYALDRCEQAFRERAWASFGHWHRIYLEARRRSAPTISAEIGRQDSFGEVIKLHRVGCALTRAAPHGTPAP